MRVLKILTAAIVATSVMGALASVASAAPSTATSAGRTAAGQRYHVVQSGDTVDSIAERYGVSSASIVAANGIVGGRLYLGARVLIDNPNPGRSAGLGSTAASSNQKRASTSSRSGSYTIKSGDALERIARRHGVTLAALLSANGLKSTSLILPGDKLVIPGGSGSTASSAKAGSAGSGSGSGAGSASGPSIVCPVPGGSFVNDWGFPRGGGRFHEGTDVFAARGTTIVAPLSGTLSFSSNKLGGTTFTITSPSGWVAYGSHLGGTIGSSRQVKAGSPIATVGDSGNAKGGPPHLHLGLKPSGGRAINPYPSLSAAC